MEKLKYLSTETYHEGIIVEVTDGGVAIDLKGRLGHIRLPRRMLITDWALEVGMEVGFVMSYPEVLSPEINEEYRNNIQRHSDMKSTQRSESKHKDSDPEDSDLNDSDSNVTDPEVADLEVADPKVTDQNTEEVPHGSDNH